MSSGMDTKPVYTFATWRIKQGQLTATLDLLNDLVAKSASEEGNLVYEVHQSNSDANTLILFEGYKDEPAFEAHRDSKHFQQLVVDKIIPMLESREIVVVTPLWLR